MKSRSIILGILLFFLVSILSNIVAAEESFDSDSKEIKELYKKSILLEKTKLFFTFDNAKKAEKALLFARDRLTLLNATLDSNNQKIIEKLQQEHDYFTKIAGNNLDKMALRNHTEEFKIETAIQAQLIGNKYLAEDLKNKAKLKAAQETNESIKKIGHAFDNFGNNIKNLEIKLANKKDKTLVRYAYIENQTKDEVQNKTSFMEKKKLDMSFEQKSKEFIIQAEKAIEKTEELFRGPLIKKISPEAKIQLATAVVKLGAAKDAFGNGDYLEASDLAFEAKKLANFARAGVFVKEEKSDNSASIKKFPTGDAIKKSVEQPLKKMQDAMEKLQIGEKTEELKEKIGKSNGNNG